MNNDFQDEYTNSGDREEQLQDKKTNKKIKIFQTIVFLFIFIMFLIIAFIVFKNINIF